MESYIAEYKKVKQQLACGWNTWNVYSVFSHVFLPDGVAINLGIKEYANGFYLKDAYIGHREEGDHEIVIPGIRSYDGSYISLEVQWRKVRVYIESVASRSHLFIRAKLLNKPICFPVLGVELGLLWGRQGTLIQGEEGITVHTPHRAWKVVGIGKKVQDPFLPVHGPFLTFSLEEDVWITTQEGISQQEIMRKIEEARNQEIERRNRIAWDRDIYDAIQICLAWNTIYDPLHERVISPVSRLWSSGSGGYVLFCWDTFFAALLAGIDNRDLAYANVLEILNEMVGDGFVPNTSTAAGFKTRDRSQPPVGSITVWQLYQKYRDRWFLEATFDSLLRWNRWWPLHRDTDGLLCWGSEQYDPITGNEWEFPEKGVHERFGAALESGLDNSPMYDDIPFDKSRNQLCLQDAGLTGLYIADCDALAAIAQVLGRGEEKELWDRANYYRKNCQRLWCEKVGIFLNRRTDTGEFSLRVSPTNFYPMLGKVPNDQQVKRMMDQFFYNPQKFFGEWMLPSISRDDPAYPDQSYWRGRIWAPMNFLVYLGMLHYNLPQVRKFLAAKSRELLLKEWKEKRHVHENYCADTGLGCNQRNSDCFYHWGGLLGLIHYMETLGKY